MSNLSMGGQDISSGRTTTKLEFSIYEEYANDK